MRAYEAYKQIDLPWLDRIPAHWRVQRAKTFFKVINERSVEGKEELLSVSSTQGVIKRNDANVTMFQAESYAGYKLCWPKDLVVNSLWAWQNGLGFSNYYGIVSTAYSVYRLKNSHANYHYYNYLLRSSAFQWELRIRSKGIWKSRYILSDEDFLNSPIICPPREEQDAIVRFLDAKCAKIDRLIKLKERQIALLNEKKQLIINQAVTRGLDPNVPMKDSGVDWIGEIPEGWEVSKLKYIGVIQTGVTLGKDYPKEATSKYPYLCVANVQDGYIDLKKIKFINLPPKEAQRYFLQKGDILMTEGGDPDKLGRGSVWNNEIAHCLHQNHIFAVRMDQKKVLISFFRFVLQAQYCKEYFLLSAKQTTNLASTNKTTLSNLYVAMPSLGAQEKIVEQLDKVAALYKTKIKIIEKKILTLREYKTKIISDCVTGKLNCIAGNDTNLGENHV